MVDLLPWFWGGGKEKEKPYIRKVVMEDEILDKALRRGREETTEVAFYLIGLIKDRYALVYDILEFPYEERSGASVSSNPENLGMLFTAVPFGLEVIGIMHKHPSGIGPSFSSVDKRTFLKWDKNGGKAHLIFSDSDVRAFTVNEEEIVSIDFEVNSLEPLSSITLDLPMTVKLFFPAKSRVLDIVQVLEKELPSETLKRFSPVRFKEKGIMDRIERNKSMEMRKRVLVRVASPNQERFTYRFFTPEDTNFGTLKGKITSTLSLDPSTDFYTEEGRILEKTPVSKLTGKIIYPRTSIREIITQQVSNQLEQRQEKTLLKDKIKQLSTSVTELKSEMEELKSMFQEEIKKQSQRVEKNDKKEEKESTKKNTP